jgi:2-(1,2-epoxy-1,2-dihydrophenyl)acetyl-CoA isomerase
MPDLLIDHDGPVAVLTLNRPDRLNALTSDLGEELDAALGRLAADPEVRAIVLTGAGRAFCSGADLKGASKNGGEALLRDVFNPLVRTIAELDVPVVAAVNGVAAGAGASLTFACDLRVAAAGARFQLSFAKVGLVPDCGATWTLPRIVGSGRAADLALLGRDLGAEEAHQWGLVNRLVADGEALTAGIALAHQLAGVSSTLGATKALLREAHDRDLPGQLDAEASGQGEAQRGPDFAEARQAFVDKRPARFAARAPQGV